METILSSKGGTWRNQSTTRNKHHYQKTVRFEHEGRLGYRKAQSIRKAKVCHKKVLTLCILKIWEHTVSETGNYSYSRVLNRTQGSEMGQNKTKKRLPSPRGGEPGPKGTVQTVQAHHGTGMGKDGDLSRKGLRNQWLEESFTWLPQAWLFVILETTSLLLLATI